MAKRARSSIPRGPSNRDLDLYPNFLSWSLATSAADTVTTSTIFTPIPRLQTRGNKAIVMELLELLVLVWQTPRTVLVSFDAQFDAWYYALGTGKAPTAMPALSDGSVFSNGGRGCNFVTSGLAIQEFPYRYSLVNNDGRGYLLGTDSFYCLVDTNSIGATCTFDFKLMYRFVEVDLAEYVGLVQSQTQSAS